MHGCTASGLNARRCIVVLHDNQPATSSAGMHNFQVIRHLRGRHGNPAVLRAEGEGGDEAAEEEGDQRNTEAGASGAFDDNHWGDHWLLLYFGLALFVILFVHGRGGKDSGGWLFGGYLTSLVT